MVTLTGNNSFAGNITVNSGGLKILNAAALGTGPKTVILTNGTNGRPQFYLDGSGGNITVPAGINFDTSVNDINRPVIGNLAGDNVIEGNITLKSGGGDSQVRVLGGTLALNGQIAANTNLTLNDLGANALLPVGTKLVLVDYSGVWDDTDIVHFNGTPVPNGSTISFGANTYVVDYSDDSGSLGGTSMTLTAAVAGNPYTSWADSFSLVGANRAPTADPDNDGLDNGVEFVIGANPNTFTPAGDRPTATVTGGNLVFTFKRSDASEAFDVFVEHGTTLSEWPGQMLVPVVETEGPPVDVADNGPSTLDDVTVTIPMGTDTRKFARLRADIPYTP